MTVIVDVNEGIDETHYHDELASIDEYGNLTINVNDYNNYLGPILVNGGPHDDNIYVQSIIEDSYTHTPIGPLIYGGAGNDVIDGGALYSINNFDSVYATGAAYGGDGNDTLSIYVANAYGGNGNDVIRGPENAYGGDGNDIITVSTIFDGVVYGGAGDDTLNVSFSYADDAGDRFQGSVYGDDGNDHINAYVENTYGGDGDDVINGGNNAYGGDGNDFVYGISSASGGAGNDVVEVALGGGDGGDVTASGDDGNDYVYGALAYGGAGDDVVYGKWASGDDGNDIVTGTIYGADGGSGDDIVTALDGGASAYGGDGNDTVTASANYGDAHGGAGDDIVTGYWAYGDAGNDHVYGADPNSTPYGDGDNFLYGGDGNDVLTGGAGNDLIDGGDGIDVAAYSGAITDYTITANADGTTTVSDNRLIGDGTDTLQGIEFLQFGSAFYTISGAPAAPPTANADNVSGLVEATPYSAGVATASGNALTNDTFNAPSGMVTGIGAGDTENFQSVVGPTSIDGLYGTLTINPDGSYTYNLDNGLAATNALKSGDHVSDVFTYQIADALGQTGQAQITIGVDGADDAQVTTGIDRLLVTSGQASNLDASVLLANDSVTLGETLTVTSVSNAVGGAVSLISGKLVINASGSASFDYKATSTTGATAIGHVTVSTVATDDLVNKIIVGSTYTAADIVGQGGNDVLTGHNGVDRLVGGVGNDVLNGVSGADLLIGGLGDDTYQISDAAAVIVENASEGTDKVNASVSYTLSANVEKLTLTGAANLDGTGNDLANVITGNTGDNHLYGGAGNDTLSGGDGADTLYGGDGNDKLDGGTGADTLVGGTGDDTYTVDNIGDVVIENANEGTDTVNASVGYTLSDNVEKLTLTGTANIDGTGNALANTLTGNAGDNHLYGMDGNDTLTGGAGNDTLDGGTGADTLYGGDGNDTLYGGDGADKLDGGTGADTMAGGTGDDTYVVDNVGDVVIENPGEGTDTVSASVSFTLGANIETLTLTGTANIDGTGNDLANKLTGNTGDNHLYGGAGADTLTGGAGNDSLYGGADKDSLNGGDGNDWLDGGAGADSLTGGAGADSFVFDVMETTANKDTIKDFEHGIDHIVFDHAVFAALSFTVGGALDPSQFVLGAAAATAGQHLIYNPATGALYYDPDGHGGAAQVEIALLSTKPVLDSHDFMLI